MAASEAPDQAPRLVPVTPRVLVVVPIRLALGLALLAAAAAVSEREAANLFRQFFVGAVVFGFIALASEGRRLGWTGELDALPANARIASLPAVTLEAIFPSTVGVAVLGAASLAFEPRLSALLAGLLVGMGLAPIPLGAQLAWWERQHRLRLFATPGLRPRVYARRGEAPRRRPS